MTALSNPNRSWEYLPSLNLNLHPVSNINLRFGVARSITLPEYIDTAPSMPSTSTSSLRQVP